MSSELRLKKLRGSGGYIMARITDQQQMKGNLGGPDLFLAPIGRIEPNSITKHFCNTCEKEFENSPKIDYENPNEQVAENLILMERGQYICNACNSSIAEYREFKKTDESQDIGMAKSLEDRNAETRQPPQPAAEQQPATRQPPQPAAEQQPATRQPPQPAAEQQPATRQPPQPAAEQQPATRQPPQPAAEQQPATQTTVEPQKTDSMVNSIVGMTVFDENAKRLGTAKQVGVDSSQTIVLIITKDDGTEVVIPWTKIKTVGEVVLLGDPGISQPVESKSGKCSSCGFSNKTDAKFCEECGNNIS